MCETKSGGNSGIDMENHSSLFSTFFGRPRLNLKLLDQAVSYNEEDDDEVVLAPLLEKSHLPLLRDLSVDPATLCKAASVFAKFSSTRHHVNAGWTLTRVAVRLLSSKNARLMKECTIHDLIRLCEAAALSNKVSHGREMIIGLFARKIIQVLGSPSTDSTSLSIQNASPTEIASLLWSFGELGIKHSLGEEDRRTAYRRMRFVADKRLLSKDQIKLLPDEDIVKLLRGMVGMKYTDTDRHFLLDVVLEVEGRPLLLRNADTLAALVEAISVVKESMRFDAEKRTVIEDGVEQRGDLDDSVNATRNDENMNKKTDDTSSPDQETEESEDSEALPVIGDKSVDEEILRSCEALLGAIADASESLIKDLRIDDIRRLLTVYSLLPFQAENFVGSAAAEIEERRRSLDIAWRHPGIDALLIGASENARNVNTTLFGEANEDSPFEVIKSKLKTLFSGKNSDGDEDDLPEDDMIISEELSGMIKVATESTLDLAEACASAREASQISPDAIFHELKESTAFEIGRCMELIENYRRNEFSTGTRRSRFDSRRQEVTKRILSRLIP